MDLFILLNAHLHFTMRLFFADLQQASSSLQIVLYRLYL